MSIFDTKIPKIEFWKFEIIEIYRIPCTIADPVSLGITKFNFLKRWLLSCSERFGWVNVKTYVVESKSRNEQKNYKVHKKEKSIV